MTTSTDRRIGTDSAKGIKAPCRVATDSNITLNGLQTIDGVLLSAGDRVLVRSQNDLKKNGIWIADTSDWKRAADFDSERDIAEGTLVKISNGSVYSGGVFELTSTDPVVIGTSDITFAIDVDFVTVSPFMETVLDDTTDQIARTTLGAERQFQINVKEYGAVGDGLTDDVVALQNSINAVNAAGGGTIYFPYGTYLISTQLNLCSNLQLESNSGAVIKLKDNSVGSLTNGAMLYATSKTDIQIIGITLDGNKSNNDINDNYGDGIRLSNVQRAIIHRCYIYNVPRDGISIAEQIAGANSHINISENLVTGSGSVSQTTGGEGILVVEGKYISVSNNICWSNKLRGIDIETLTATITYWSLVGNICYYNESGITVNGATSGNVVGNSCNENTIYGISLASSAPTNGYITISGNNVVGAAVTDYGISSAKYGRITISGNNVSSCDYNIYLSDAFLATLSSNTLIGANRNGLDFSTGTNTDIVVSGNIIEASNQSNSGYSNVTGNTTYATIVGNRIKHGTLAVYGIVTAGSGWTIECNTLDESGVTAEISDGASSSRIRHNGGWITESSGTGTILNATTSIAVTHNLSITPSIEHIKITGSNNPTNDPGNIWITNPTSTQFTVNCRSDPGAGGMTFGWQVRY